MSVTATMVTVHAQALVEAAVERRAKEVLGRAGLSVDEAMRQMLTRTATDGALPFTAEDSPMVNAAEHPEYDAWFRAQVQDALDDDSPGIAHEVVKEEWAQQRAELLARSAAKHAA